MKIFTRLSLLLFFVSTCLFAQQEKGIIGYNNWLNPWTEFKPNKISYNKPTQIISGDITQDTKLYKRDTYLLLGDVFVTDSTTLTIEPGTVIIGDFDTKASLIISKGSKIIANGSSTDPIIFTSSRSMKKPGDWGGLFILGDAPTSKFDGEGTLSVGLNPTSSKNMSYGGDNPEGDSGILSHVRIEFAGKRTKNYGYYSGLTLAGVGYQTTVNNVMVSYCKGNSFSIIGGNIILENLVSYRAESHDYEFNYGAQTELFNSLAIRSPYSSSSVASKCINVLAHEKAEEVDLLKNQTKVNAENLTLVNISDNLDYDIQIGLVDEAIFIGANTSFSIDKSVISGFNPAVILDENTKINSESLNDIEFTKTYFNNCNGNIFRNGYTNNDDLENWYGSRAFNNVYSKGPDSETFINAGNSNRPDYRLRINQIIAAQD